MDTSNIKPTISDSYTPGAILIDRWGNEQTNVDFYCIVQISGVWITVMPMTKITSPIGSNMVKFNLPDKIDDTAKPIRKKLKFFGGEPTGFSFRSYSGGGWCRLWKGETSTSSYYA